MNLFKVKISLKEVISWILLVSSYLILRFINIMSLPMFTDEAIYTRWSQIARFDPSWRFISLTDGKQPLFVWFDMTLMRLVRDPLLAGRIVSVGAGLVTMVGLYFLTKEIFKNKKMGFIASILYLFYPMGLVYDRMALYDSLVAATMVWALFFEVLLVRYKRLDLAFMLGMSMGAAVLTKTIGFFSIYLLPFSLFLFNFKDKKKKESLIKFAGFSLVAVVLAYLYYSVLRLSPFFNIIDTKNGTFIYTFSQWKTHPFDFFWGNLHGVLDWLTTYMSYPTLLLVVLSFIIKKERFLEKLLLFVWFSAPFLALALFGKVLYPRFILFMTIPLLSLAAFSLSEILDKIKTKTFKVLVFAVLILPFFWSDFLILTDFAKAPIPKSDLGQYINDWPAGGGSTEIVNYLANEAKKGKIYVASLGTFGSLPTYSVEIYLGNNKNIDKMGIYPVPTTIPSSILAKAKIMPTYLFVSNQKEFEKAIETWPLTLIVEYRKGIGNAYSKLYKVEK